MDTDSSCFVPLTSRKSIAKQESTGLMSTAKSVEQDDLIPQISKDETRKKGLTACAKTELQKELENKKEDSFHIGSLKWAKYKKKEKGQKTTQIVSEFKGYPIDKREKENFAFPDGGWVCSQCQNYNFAGRVRCNRCTKQKTKSDFNGKPKHLLKKPKNHEGALPKSEIVQKKAEPK